MRHILNRNHRVSEPGFSLIEILVVILILGIMAAIAVPTFTGQGKTNRDRDTTTAVNLVVSATKNLLLQHPRTSDFGYKMNSVGGGLVYLDVNANGLFDSGEPSTLVGVSSETKITIVGHNIGSFSVYGWNISGRNYISQFQALTYNSINGTIADNTGSSPIPAS